MQEQITLTKDCFDSIEKDILKTAKSLIETFKFKMIFETKVSKKQKEQTINDIKEFRVKNWDKKLSRDKAYKKYVSMY